MLRYQHNLDFHFKGVDCNLLFKITQTLLYFGLTSSSNQFCILVLLAIWRNHQNMINVQKRWSEYLRNKTHEISNLNYVIPWWCYNKLLFVFATYLTNQHVIEEKLYKQSFLFLIYLYNQNQLPIHIFLISKPAICYVFVINFLEEMQKQSNLCT